MISTNQIEQLLDEIERLPYKPTNYQWLKDLLEEVKEQPTQAVHIGIVKSKSVSEMLKEEIL